MELMPGVTAHDIDTDRLRVHYLQSGAPDGIPVVLVHGNLSTGRFYETVMSGAPEHFRFIAPDMRGFGRSERKALDATRGLRDWADDTYALVQALGIESPVHLAGWSTGGAAVAAYAMDRHVASLTFIDPVSPYGFGGCHRDGTPCFPDWAGTGGGTGNPEFVQRLQSGDRSDESPFSPRNVMASSYWSPSYTMPSDRLDLLVDEVLLSVVGDEGYPGDATVSENWPGMAPGTTGILNALSGKYCNWAGIVDMPHKPPVLWTHGTADIVIADGSAWEMGTLGAAGYVPGWPGAEVYPPQPQVTQIRDVLEEYERRGGRVQIEMIEGSGHGPVLDASEQWNALFYAFLDSAS
ncbi:MAG: alpha/beta hydrolase [Actinomycetales bacterium]|nr:alpha/beta hydrolase [Actinomycetales bacterium]